MRPTIADVAREAGVTKGTVSHVYNGHRPISTPTKEKVHAAAKKLGWIPNANASALAGRHTNAVGLVLHKNPDVLAVDTFFPVFISGMQAELSQRQIMLVMQVVDSQIAEERAYRSMAHGRADGVVVLDIHREDWRIPFLAKLRLPAVLMDVPHDYPGFTAVRIDSGKPMAELVDHLRQQGHTKIAHISGPLGYVHAYERAVAYVRQTGSRELLRQGDFTAQSGRKLTADLLSLSHPPTAIIYSNNVMAIAGQAYAQEQGLHIPEDLALAGFEDDEICAHLNPPLTSVDTGPAERGRLAAQQLIQVVAETFPKSVTAPAPVIRYRGSTEGKTPLRTLVVSDP